MTSDFASCRRWASAMLFSLAVTTSLARLARAGETSKAAEDEARLHFTAGVNLLRDPARPRYDEAYIEFQKAYALLASPKILGNLGLCAMKLERDAEAIDAFTRYLSDVSDLPTDERIQIERDVSTLKATLATVSIDSKPSGVTISDTRVPAHGEPVPTTYGPFAKRTDVRIRKGHHIFKGRFDGGREVTWEADITGGESHVFEVAAQAASTPTKTSTPKSPAGRPVPTSVFVASGVTAALGVGSLVTGLVALNKHSSFEERNDGYDPTAADDLRQAGTTLNVVSDMLLVGTIIAAGATVYLYFARPASSAPSMPRTTGSSVGTPLTVRF
jgi:hypothetical protein